MVVVDTNSYKSFTKDINRSDVFVDYIVKKHGCHTADNSVISIFIKKINSNETYVVNFLHQDFPKIGMDSKTVMELITQSSNRAFVVDKKRFLNIFGNKNVNDLLIFEFQAGYTSADEVELSTNYHTFSKYKLGSNYRETNYVIPMSKHIEWFELKYAHFMGSIEEFEVDNSYNQLNGIITETLSEVECNGIYVDVIKFNDYFKDKGTEIDTPLVYTEYNIFTSTGRPSNRFNKINYAALNKDDGCRSAFVSRFSENGLLISLDYSAYHPHIIANLINYKVEPGLNIYEYLGRSYFNKETLTPEDIKKSKNITFQNLYGGIRDEYLHIDYFKKVSEYIDHRWKFFNKHGYVETPVFKRRITENHISDPNPNKLFNYLLQAAETEFSIQNIDRINRYLRNKKSKVVLYTYDSILIDICGDDKKDTLTDIKTIMVDNQFPVKCHAGKNYNEMIEIKLN